MIEQVINGFHRYVQVEITTWERRVRSPENRAAFPNYNDINTKKLIPPGEYKKQHPYDFLLTAIKKTSQYLYFS